MSSEYVCSSGVLHAEDVLKVLEQQAHSALSEQSSSSSPTSISSQEPSTAPGRPVSKDGLSGSRTQGPAISQVITGSNAVYAFIFAAQVLKSQVAQPSHQSLTGTACWA